MNKVVIIGRLTADPEVRYTDNQLAICNFNVALNRGIGRDGEDLGADFPRCKAFGKTAENMGKFLAKGSLVGIEGRLQTGSYTNKNGDKVYTTEVNVNSIEFLSRRNEDSGYNNESNQSGGSSYSAPEGFGDISDDDIPF